MEMKFKTKSLISKPWIENKHVSHSNLVKIEFNLLLLYINKPERPKSAPYLSLKKTRK